MIRECIDAGEVMGKVMGIIRVDIPAMGRHSWVREEVPWDTSLRSGVRVIPTLRNKRAGE